MDKEDLTGVWELISFDYRKSDGSLTYPFGEDAKGLLIYTQSGYMSAQIANSRRSCFEGEDPLNGTLEEIKSAFLSSAAYYGQYQVDVENKTVYHRTDISTLPNQSKSVQERHYSFEGENLILKTPLTQFGGEVITGTLVWKRIG